jgi:hypothetical protein
MPTPLPLLDSIRIAAPCPASWDDMAGDDRVRHCSLCQQSVYNVAALSRTEANALVTQATGRMCLRLFRRADGMVMTRDCPVGVLRAARRRLAGVVGAWAFVFLVALGWFTLRPGAVRAARAQVQELENRINPRPRCETGDVAPQAGMAAPVAGPDEKK